MNASPERIQEVAEAYARALDLQVHFLQEIAAHTRNKQFEGVGYARERAVECAECAEVLYELAVELQEHQAQ